LETIGYHTVEDRNNPEYIRENAPFIGTKPNQWLGIGCYFWDDNLKHAHNWGKNSYRKGYVICEAKISLQNVLDLHNNTKDQEYYKERVEEVKVYLKYKRNIDVPISKAVAFLQKLNEKKQGMFPYFGIRASDYPPQDKFLFVEGRHEYTLLNPRIQICIFKKTQIIFQIQKLFTQISIKHYKMETLFSYSLEEFKKSLYSLTDEEFNEIWHSLDGIEFGGPTIEEYLAAFDENSIAEEFDYMPAIFVGKYINLASEELSYANFNELQIPFTHIKNNTLNFYLPKLDISDNILKDTKKSNWTNSLNNEPYLTQIICKLCLMNLLLF
jgi:hypothetical protein